LVTSYKELWREVQARLLAASALMQADAPGLYERRTPQLNDANGLKQTRLSLRTS
jgi:hypothetical protein